MKLTGGWYEHHRSLEEVAGQTVFHTRTLFLATVQKMTLKIDFVAHEPTLTNLPEVTGNH